MIRDLDLPASHGPTPRGTARGIRIRTEPVKEGPERPSAEESPSLLVAASIRRDLQTLANLPGNDLVRTTYLAGT